jgi:hypothetical protein
MAGLGEGESTSSPFRNERALDKSLTMNLTNKDTTRYERVRLWLDYRVYVTGQLMSKEMNETR